MYKSRMKAEFETIKNLDEEKVFYDCKIDELLGVEKFTRTPICGPNYTFEQEGSSELFKPDCADLTRLFYIITHFKIINVLEFGSGISSMVMGEAIRQNKEKFQDKINLIRRKKPFHVFSLECEYEYLVRTKGLIEDAKNQIDDFVNIINSSADLVVFNNAVCGAHDELPVICPDFIYVDGPSPYSYRKNSLNGIGLSHPDITNITCDVLKIEHLLLPGTIVLFDGMTNNARFHLRNLKREWLYHEDTAKDFSLFMLYEDSVGVHHNNHLDFVYS